MLDTVVVETNLTVDIKAHEVARYVLVCDATENRTLNVRLIGEGASVQIYGIYVGSKKDMLDLKVSVEHLAPHTKSEILCVGALAGSAKTNVLGEIHIAKSAYGSSGREEIKTLLLSKDAQIRTNPKLKIENNDVKCSHAVTTTHIDEEKKFYLESRGMGEEEAVQSVVYGHFAPILDQISDERTRKKIAISISFIR